MAKIENFNACTIRGTQDAQTLFSSSFGGNSSTSSSVPYIALRNYLLRKRKLERGVAQGHISFP